jgi:pyruvate carboxylase
MLSQSSARPAQAHWGDRFRRGDYLTIGLQPRPCRCSAIARSVPAAEKTALDKPSHVAAAFAEVVAGQRAEDDVVGAEQTVAKIETMMMQAAITAPKAGSVARVAVSQTVQVEGGDLSIVLSQLIGGAAG